MPGRGLEPLRISPPDPKSGASANFATLAQIRSILPQILGQMELTVTFRLGKRLLYPHNLHSPFFPQGNAIV
jgi:hypothetical protein